MKIKSDELPCELCPSAMEITLDKLEQREIYQAMARAEVGETIVLENGLTFKIEEIITHGENNET